MHSGLRGPGTLFLQCNDPSKESTEVPISFMTTKELYSENELVR